MRRHSEPDLVHDPADELRQHPASDARGVRPVAIYDGGMPYATIGLTCSAAPVPAPTRFQYTEIAGPQRLELAGAQTYNVDLAMMPPSGCCAVEVTSEAQDDAGNAITAPVVLSITSNAQTKTLELMPGGLFAHVDPNPSHGITGLSITTTVTSILHVTAFG